MESQYNNLAEGSEKRKREAIVRGRRTHHLLVMTVLLGGRTNEKMMWILLNKNGVALLAGTIENHKENIPQMLPWAHVMQPTTEVGIKNIGKPNNRLGVGAI